MSRTPKLKLPYLQERQAQKHVSVNESLKLLDGIVQPVVERKDINTPPSARREGLSYITGTRPTSDWRGKPNHIAIYDANGRWFLIAPKTGWTVWIKNLNRHYTYYNSAWRRTH